MNASLQKALDVAISRFEGGDITGIVVSVELFDIPDQCFNQSNAKFIIILYTESTTAVTYRISGNFRENLIFAIFASDLKTRKYVSAKNCT